MVVRRLFPIQQKLRRFGVCEFCHFRKGLAFCWIEEVMLIHLLLMKWNLAKILFLFNLLMAAKEWETEFESRSIQSVPFSFEVRSLKSRAW